MRDNQVKQDVNHINEVHFSWCRYVVRMNYSKQAAIDKYIQSSVREWNNILRS